MVTIVRPSRLDVAKMPTCNSVDAADIARSGLPGEPNCSAGWSHISIRGDPPKFGLLGHSLHAVAFRRDLARMRTRIDCVAALCLS